MRYSVVITPYPVLEKFGAYVPAFDRRTEGHSIEEALDMARDLIEICIGFAREDGTELPVETSAAADDRDGGRPGRAGRLNRSSRCSPVTP